MEVPVRELKNRLSEYLRKVSTGHEVVVTSRGKVVARRNQPAEEEAIALLRTQPWIRPGKVGKQRVGLVKPIKLKPGTKSLSEIVSEMRD
jgi:antitoxin (DNA-binding transcriptional repressor) of toxin-antitoxin stability system